MARLAHLSDVHLTAPRSRRRAYGMRCRAVRFGRPSDPAVRARRLRSALEQVKALDADHLVITGDLTELGDDAEFAHFAESLSEAGLDPERVTLIPGNHDAYTTADGWRRALEGPLGAWAETSAPAGGFRIVDRGSLVVVPIDVSRHQPLLLSCGELHPSVTEAIEGRLSAASLADKAVVLAIHHCPYPRRVNAAARLFDALRGGDRLLALVAKDERLHVMHGHLHRAVDRTRIFGAPAVADDDRSPRVRLYDVAGGRVEDVSC